MSRDLAIQFAYLAASILLVGGLSGLTNPKAARRGLFALELGMGVAVVATLLRREIVTYEFIALGVLVGGLLGTIISLRIPMTKMPERIAFSHAFGGLAVTLVGVVEVLHRQHGPPMNVLQEAAVGAEIMLGAVTFTGSVMAFGKLQGFVPGRPVTFPGQNLFNGLIIVTLVGLLAFVVARPDQTTAHFALLGLALLLGVTLVLPIGGADMPVVICLLNAYAGLAASATGFALKNNVLIICGALDGGSGLILGMLMAKAMNRSFWNVLFGAFGSLPGAAAQAPVSGRAPNEASLDDALEVLAAAQTVIVVPGYGMAVSQAQHALNELATMLEQAGCDVRYAIHPVAGRMPGHMNVLLAEANVPYEKLYDLDAINDDFGTADVALVVGANDVVNPAAKEDPASPIFGMPILAADRARSCIVLKRSLNPGFAGIENQLFVKENTMLVLGDAKKTLRELGQALRATAEDSAVRSKPKAAAA